MFKSYALFYIYTVGPRSIHAKRGEHWSFIEKDTVVSTENHLRVEKNNRFDFFKKDIINFKLQENGCLVKNSNRILNNFSFV